MAHGYLVDLRERAIGYVHRGGSRADACEVFQIGSSTLDRWLRQYKLTGNVRSKPNGSSPWKLDYQAILNYIKNKNDSTLREVADHFDTVVSVIDYVLRKFGIYVKKSRSTPSETRKKASCLAEIKSIDPRKIIYIDKSGVEDTLFRQSCFLHMKE